MIFVLTLLARNTSSLWPDNTEADGLDLHIHQFLKYGR